jgi:hypothetical protein
MLVMAAAQTIQPLNGIVVEVEVEVEVEEGKVMMEIGRLG